MMADFTPDPTFFLQVPYTKLNCDFFGGTDAIYNCSHAPYYGIDVGKVKDILITSQFSYLNNFLKEIWPLFGLYLAFFIFQDVAFLETA